MHRVRTVAATLIVALVASFGHAFDFPRDADFIVTDAQGVIVAIGRGVDGTSAVVEVLSGFEGPARLTLFGHDGSTRAVDVAIADGIVTIDGVDLRVVLSEVFEDVEVRFVAEPGLGADVPGRASDGASGGADEGVGPDGVPPGQERRPEEPPGQERRPDELPRQDVQPEDPPGQDRRPSDPPRADRAR